MGRKSTIELLDEPFLNAINECFEANLTLDEITKKIQEMGAKVSRSALGRYKLNFDEMMEHVKHSRIVAETLVDNLGDASESKVARANIELLHSALLKINLDNVGELDAKEVLALSKSVEALAKARKIDQDTIIEVHEMAIKKAASMAAKEGKKAGLTAASIEDIRQGILGIKAE